MCLMTKTPLTLQSLKVTQLVVTGEWSSGSMSALLDLAMGGCLQMDTILRETLREDS